MTTRGVICDAIEAWRDGETCNAVHPIAGQVPAWLYDPDTVKDLARVITRYLEATP